MSQDEIRIAVADVLGVNTMDYYHGTTINDLPDFTRSYDAWLPFLSAVPMLILERDGDCNRMKQARPATAIDFCEALLRKHGKWIEHDKILQ